MLSAYVNSVKIPELRQRILFTLGIIALVRIAANIPCPGIDTAALEQLFQNMRETSGGGRGLLGIFDLFSGGALQRFAVAALGIMPYITASIVMQLLMPVIPALEKLRNEGETGRQKINQYTRYLTLVVCVVHGTAAVKIMNNPGAVFRGVGQVNLILNPGPVFTISTVIILAAGTMLLVWLGEQITDRGIGNGITLIITVNIVSRLPSAFWGLVTLVRGGVEGGGNIINVLLLVVMFFVVCAGTVALTQGQRKIPIRHARRMAGRQMTAGQTSYLPLRVNFSGVMPIIFGSAILTFPRMVLQWIPFTRNRGWVSWFTYGTNSYMIMFGVVIIVFSYFWVATQFNPIQIADNLQKQGGYIPGIRPGQPTAEFLDTTMTRITFAGALFLTAIAVLPMIMANEFQIPFTVAAFFGGTSLLIMVGVLLDTLRQVEAYLLSHHYDGFLSKGRLRSRRGGGGVR
ncbi:MAG: preprotein translocase subunit SecY [Candidatus Pacebacteria bacterium]|nr:preprotein translocase subunit SecY [Candidatus Paceibacterota bacterium]